MVQVRTGVGLLAAAASTFAAALVLLASPAGADSAPEITSTPPQNPGTDTSPTWTFNDGGGGQLSCRLSGPGRLDAVYTPCSSPMTYDLGPDGPYTFAVRRQPPNAESTTTAATSTYVLDTRAPVTITSRPTNLSPDSSVSWGFSAETGATFRCKLGLAGSTPEFSTCNSGDTFQLPTDGTYTFTVEARDPLGNTGTAEATHTRQTLPPPPPDPLPPLTPLITSPLGRVSQNPSSGWSFTAEAATSTFCQLSPSGANPSGFTACSSPQSYALVADGTYTFSVYATNTSGTSDTTTDTYTLDRSAPAAPVITSTPSSPGNATTVGWGFQVPEPGNTMSCQLALGTTILSALGPCTTSTSATFGLGAGDGLYTFSVRATDAAGNSGPAATSTYLLDTAAPAAPVLGRGPGSPGTDTTPRWTFRTEEATTSECMLASGSVVIASWAPCSGTQSYRLSDAGSYLFSVRALDAAGNTSPISSAVYDFRPAPAGPRATTPTAPAGGPLTNPGKPPTAAPGAPEPSNAIRPSAAVKPDGAAFPTTEPSRGPRPIPPIPSAGPRSAPALVVVQTPPPAPAPVSAPARPQAVPQTVTRSAPVEVRPTPGLAPRSVIAKELAAVTTPDRSIPEVGVPGPSELNAGDESAAPPALLPSQGGETVAETILDVGVEAVKKSAFPLLLLLIVFLFLVVQDRIDRRDPKLALAPVYRDAALSFTPPPTKSPPRHD